jgi:hypothetical protein
MGRALVEAERSYILQNRDWLLRQAPETVALGELASQ